MAVARAKAPLQWASQEETWTCPIIGAAHAHNLPMTDLKPSRAPVALAFWLAFQLSFQLSFQLTFGLVFGLALSGLFAAPAHAQSLPLPGLPAAVEAALARAQLPSDAISVLVQEVPQGNKPAPPRASHRAQTPMNPASLMKLVTTFAAMDQLGPAYTWNTAVWGQGPIKAGVLHGNLTIVGQGDPKLVMERLWLLLRRVQGLGIKQITGDIVLDHSAFDVPEQDPAQFDGEPLRPYNATPDALLLNFKAVVLTFVPDRASGTALVAWEPPLAGVTVQASVPLSGTANNAACGDYRATLKADFVDPRRIRFGGSYSAACGEKVWPVAYADPKSYAVRAVAGLWAEMGGKLGGSVRDGRLATPLTGGGTNLPATPSAAPSSDVFASASSPAAGVVSGGPTAAMAGGASGVSAASEPPRLLFEVSSPTLVEVVRDVNKYSNNVMAQQVFLTLGAVAGASGGGGNNGKTAVGFANAREALRAWWQDRIGTPNAPLVDNGSGLSRAERISALGLADVLAAISRSPWMPEMLSSLPIVGVDGTLRRSKNAAGSAHLKTGTLRDVVGMAGIVHARGGKQFMLVGIVNHANAQAARPALDALVDWTTKLD